jgi:hypothetical protein
MTSIIKGLPPRLKLDEKLNSFGGVDTIKTEDNYIHCFDDTKTIVFKNVSLTNGGISYPLGINSGSYVIRNSEMRSTIFADGKVTKGVGDAEASFLAAQPVKTFTDNTVTFDYGTPSKENKFYLTGSGYDGFSRPTLSKTKIEIPISIVGNSTISISSGSIQFMGYHNFETATLDPVGTVFTWFDDIAYSSADFFVESASIGFGPSCGSSVQQTIDQYGLPIDTFNFPYAPKYEPTSQQLLSLSDYISKPFLLEKVKLEFSASMSMNNTPNAEAVGGVAVTNFFLLTQRPCSTRGSISTPQVAASNGLPLTALTTTPDSNIRDLVTFGRVASKVSDPTSRLPGMSSEKNMDLVIQPTIVSTNVDSFDWAGQKILLMDVKAPYQMLGTGRVTVSSTNQKALTRNSRGSRNGLGTATGRDRNPMIPQINSSHYTNDSGGDGYISDPPFASSPYLLFPSDKIVLGWQVPLPTNPISLSAVSAGSSLTISAGNWKLTFYGSYVKEDKEYHEGTKSSLSSVRVHEAVSGGVPLDEFQTEPKAILRNSYTDLIFSQNRTNTFFSRIVNHKVGLTSNAESYDSQLFSEYTTITLNPKLSRNFSYMFTQHISADERFYDTVLPRWNEISAVNGAALVYSKYFTDIFHSLNLEADKYIVKIILNDDHSSAIATTTPTIINVSDNLWKGAYFFDDAYAGVYREPVVFSTKAALILTATEDVPSMALVYSSTVDMPSLAGKSPIYLIQLKYNDGTNAQRASIDYKIHFDGFFALQADAITNPTQIDFAKMYFGYKPKTLISTGTPDSGNFFLGSSCGASIRGWRFGILSGIPTYTKAVYNKNHYGQFRDRLEQRSFSKFYNTGSDSVMDSPVKVIYVGAARTISTPIAYNLLCEKESRVKKPYADV